MRILHTLLKAARDVRGHFAADPVELLPFVDTLRHYDADKLRHDSRAAANVTPLAVSQAMAFASIAGLPVEYGVLCTAVAALVAPLFSASRHTIMGPTNATAFMLFSFFSVNHALVSRWSELIPLLVLMVGVIVVLGSLLRVADLMQFVSRSVLVGYLSGAAVLIITNQAVSLLDVGRWIDEDATASFVGLVVGVAKVLHHANWVSVGIGAATLGLYGGLLKWKPHWPVFAIALVLSSALFGSLIRFHVAPFEGAATFTTFGFDKMMPHLPHLIRPGIFNDISSLLGVAFAIAFLASLENTLMAKGLASRSGDHADVNQDMFSVGMANIASCFAGGMPASGSLTRSALNFESGARTRFASFFTGIYSLGFALLIAASAGWGVPLIDYLPKAALAALVIALSFSLFNMRHIRICLRSTGDDAAVLVVTSGDRRVDEKKVEALVGKLGRADAAFVKEKTGYSIGGVPPIAHATPSVTLIDQELLRFEVIWAAAGHPHGVFQLGPQDLLRLSGAPLADVVAGSLRLVQAGAADPLAARAALARSGAQDVPSPCIAVCQMDSRTGLCAGCYRTLDEIALWSRADDAGKRLIWKHIEERAQHKPS